MQSFPKPMSAKEEEECIIRYQAGDKSARQLLIEKNLRLVAYIVKKYNTSDRELDDLLSIGTIGLIKGVDSFDSSKKIRLATYCARCIENEILMYIRTEKKSSKNVYLYDSIGSDKEGNEINLIDVIEYEDDDVVVIRRTGKAFNAVVDNIDVAIKNEDGDITNIVELKSKIVKYI